MAKESTRLDHRYILVVDQEELFHECRGSVDSILRFLQENSLIKDYSLDNCTNIGNENKGFVLGRLTFRTDTYIDVNANILKFCIEELEEEGENTNDRT